MDRGEFLARLQSEGAHMAAKLSTEWGLPVEFDLRPATTFTIHAETDHPQPEPPAPVEPPADEEVPDSPDDEATSADD